MKRRCIFSGPSLEGKSSKGSAASDGMASSRSVGAERKSPAKAPTSTPTKGDKSDKPERKSSRKRKTEESDTPNIVVTLAMQVNNILVLSHL